MRIDRENRLLVCEVQGALKPAMVIGYGRHMCGRITDGVSIAIGEKTAGWVLKFTDLESAYLEAQNFRARNPPTDDEKKLAAILERR